jgi:hypothetical protein
LTTEELEARVELRVDNIMEGAADIRVDTYLTSLERRFFRPALLEGEYFQTLRRAYETTLGTGFFNPYRNYTRLLELLERIDEYDPQHAKSFLKRLTCQASSFDSCQAIFAEIIVYSGYIPLVREGLISRLHLNEADSDLQIQRVDGSSYFLEVFCVMPNFTPTPDGVIDVKTHLQEAKGSIRQKLLRKIKKQAQLTKAREQWAVVELNHPTIAGDFSVLSSLSDGYKVWLDRSTGETVRSGYDWASSVFDDTATRHLKGVIWFSLGDYESRNHLLNPRFDLR